MTTAVLTADVPRQRNWLHTTQGAALLVAGALVTAAAAVLSNGNPLIAVAPVAAAAGAYVLYVSPIRYALFGLIFLCLTLDASGEGMWDSPLAKIGNFFLYNLNKVLPIGALVFPGMAILMFILLVLVLQRRFLGVTIDSRGRGPTALPLLGALGVGFLAVMGLCAIGAMRGGDLQMAKLQAQNYALLLLMAYLACAGFRGIRDYRTIGHLIIVAAIYRSFYVMWVVYQVAPRENKHVGVAATHGDSLLFAAAAALLLFRLFEKPSARAAAWCAGVLPILFIGMNGNNRRLVWVELACAMAVYAFVGRRTQMKRFLGRCALAALPLFVVYVAVGWNSSAKIFTPIKIYRSVTDGTTDSSTLYRDLENYNLIKTMRINPFTGVGFGQPFIEEVPLPDISGQFKEYRYMPHNAILGLWAYTGSFGFTGLFIPVVVAIYLARRSYERATTAEQRTAALMAMSIFVFYLAQCWGDIGFSELRAIFLVGPAFAIAGQLACATGAVRARPGIPS